MKLKVQNLSSVTAPRDRRTPLARCHRVRANERRGPRRPDVIARAKGTALVGAGVGMRQGWECAPGRVFDGPKSGFSGPGQRRHRPCATPSRQGDGHSSCASPCRGGIAVGRAPGRLAAENLDLGRARNGWSVRNGRKRKAPTGAATVSRATVAGRTSVEGRGALSRWRDARRRRWCRAEVRWCFGPFHGFCEKRSALSGAPRSGA